MRTKPGALRTATSCRISTAVSTCHDCLAVRAFAPDMVTRMCTRILTATPMTLKQRKHFAGKRISRNSSSRFIRFTAMITVINHAPRSAPVSRRNFTSRHTTTASLKPARISRRSSILHNRQPRLSNKVWSPGLLSIEQEITFNRAKALEWT